MEIQVQSVLRAQPSPDEPLRRQPPPAQQLSTASAVISLPCIDDQEPPDMLDLLQLLAAVQGGGQTYGGQGGRQQGLLGGREARL